MFSSVTVSFNAIVLLNWERFWHQMTLRANRNMSNKIWISADDDRGIQYYTGSTGWGEQQAIAFEEWLKEITSVQDSFL